MRFYEISETLPKELDQFHADIESFKAGDIDPVKFKAIRVAHGVYEQRQENTYMIRIRCAAGGITPEQLKRTAEMGAQYGSGEVHFTTRQEVQIHDVLIDGILPAIRGLLEVGLSTRGGGGNTIRNILTSVDSGISELDVFDVDPYAVALTSRMVQEEDSWNLPRKFKIALSNNETDTSYSQTTCLGYVATLQEGVKGFKVYCAGGMGAKPMIGHELIDFIPDTQVYHVAKALKIMFDKHGNRRSKFSSRIKFLWKKLDQEEFRRLFHEEYDQIKDDESLNLVLPDMKNEAKDTDLPVEDADGSLFDQWKQRYVYPQKQEGLVSIKIPLTLGDLLEEDAYALVSLLNHFGENTIRCDRAQNIRLRNIPEAYLGNAYNVISKIKHSLVAHAPFIGNMINCTGAQTCKLGICLPRGLSSAIRDTLTASDLDLDSITDFRLNMSGCPNTCGMHHIADLGFFGKVGRKEGDMYPAYNVLAGAEVGRAGKTKYASKVDELPAHRIPEFVRDFLAVWIERKKEASYDSYQDFLEEEGNDLIKSLCEKYKEIPSFSEDPSFYTDFGAKNRLSLDEIGTAECSAGVFDMIDVDKKTIKQQKAILNDESDETEPLYKILYASSRMLLVTRGLDAKNDEQVFSLFAKHFIETGLISEQFKAVVTLGKEDKRSELEANKDVILDLSDTVQALYKTMDDSLRFKTDSGEVINLSVPETDEVTEKDFRGVACPMNFVKTKLVLDTLKVGDKLRILLDDGAPIQNVPNSVQLEGHNVLEKTNVESHWSVLIEKNT